MLKPLIFSITVAINLSLLAASTAVADTTCVAGGQCIKSGQSMQTVEQTLGAPVKRMAAVGEPPISRWVYDGYTVYFEYDKVIHVVKHADAK